MFVTSLVYPESLHAVNTNHTQCAAAETVFNTNVLFLLAGDHGKPPALPRSGRTQLLLAAARKAQTAAFLTANPCSHEHSASQPATSQVWAWCAYVVSTCVSVHLCCHTSVASACKSLCSTDCFVHAKGVAFALVLLQACLSVHTQLVQLCLLAGHSNGA